MMIARDRPQDQGLVIGCSASQEAEKGIRACSLYIVFDSSCGQLSKYSLYNSDRPSAHSMSYPMTQLGGGGKLPKPTPSEHLPCAINTG